MNPSQNLIALATVNREFRIYQIDLDIKNNVKFLNHYAWVFNNAVTDLLFNYNTIRKKWSVLMLFEDSYFNLYEYDLLQKERKIIFNITPIYSYLFEDDPELIKNYPNLGVVTSSFSGEIKIFMNRSEPGVVESKSMFFLYWTNIICDKGQT